MHELHVREQVGGPLDAGVALAEGDLGDRGGDLRRHLANCASGG